MALNGKKIFGAGRGFAINNVTNATPTRFGLPQDMSVTFKREVKEIYGENQIAADISSGTMSVTGKLTFGTSNARLFSDLFFANAGVAGQTNEADNELGTVAGSTPFIITVANNATWTQDLGVVSVTTGNRLARVASAPVAGKSYSVAAGVYTFNASDTGLNYKISYLFTVASTGETVTLTNQAMGRVGGFVGVLVFPWTSQAGTAEQDVLTLNACIGSDTEFASKMGDYGKPTFGFTASCDQTDTLGVFSFAEAA